MEANKQNELEKLKELKEKVSGAKICIRRDKMDSIYMDTHYLYIDCNIYSIDEFLKNTQIPVLRMMVDRPLFQELVRRYLEEREYFYIGCPIQVSKYYSDDELKEINTN